jgi:hypothetical protein
MSTSVSSIFKHIGVVLARATCLHCQHQGCLEEWGLGWGNMDQNRFFYLSGRNDQISMILKNDLVVKQFKTMGLVPLRVA